MTRASALIAGLVFLLVSMGLFLWLDYLKNLFISQNWLKKRQNIFDKELNCFREPYTHLELFHQALGCKFSEDRN
jgi:hypothetical protein